jgi:hypothetical protein
MKATTRFFESVLFHIDLILAETTSKIRSNYYKQHSNSPTSSSIIPRLVEDMVSMSANTLALEDSREAQVLRNLVFRNDVVCAFGLANDEFTDL